MSRRSVTIRPDEARERLAALPAGVRPKANLKRWGVLFGSGPVLTNFDPLHPESPPKLKQLRFKKENLLAGNALGTFIHAEVEWTPPPSQSYPSVQPMLVSLTIPVGNFTIEPSPDRKLTNSEVCQLEAAVNTSVLQSGQTIGKHGGLFLEVPVHACVQVPFVIRSSAAWRDNAKLMKENLLVLRFDGEYDDSMSSDLFRRAYDYHNSISGTLAMATFDFIRKLIDNTTDDNIMLADTLEDTFSMSTRISLPSFGPEATMVMDFALKQVPKPQATQPATTSAPPPGPSTTAGPSASALPRELPATAPPLPPAFPKLPPNAKVKVRPVAPIVFQSFEDESRTKMLRQAQRIIKANRAKVKYADGTPVPAATLQNVKLPLFTGELDEKGNLIYTIGDPTNPDRAMNRVNQRKVFSDQADKMAYSLDACSEFQAPDKVFAAYPMPVYQRMLQENFDEEHMFDNLSAAQLAYPSDLNKAVLEDKTHVVRLVAGNHGTVGQAKLVKNAISQNR